MSKLKIGIVGLGRIGGIHTKNLMEHVDNAELVAICDANQVNLARFGETVGTRTYLDYRKMLTISSLDALLICTPTPSHFEIIELCCSMGIHVFCEKPLETTIARIEDIRRLVEKSGIKMQIGFNRRFDPRFSELQQRVAANEIGTLNILKITSRDPAPPPLEYLKSSGGMYMDMTIHDFDMARFICQSNVSEIVAVASALTSEDVVAANDIDTSLISMRMENGILVNIDNSRKAIYGYDQRIEAFGAEGMLSVGNQRVSEIQVDDSHGHTTAPPLNFFLERYADSFVAEMLSFVNRMCDGKEPVVGVEDALAATKMAMNANKSLIERRMISIV